MSSSRQIMAPVAEDDEFHLSQDLESGVGEPAEPSSPQRSNPSLSGFLERNSDSAIVNNSSSREFESNEFTSDSSGESGYTRRSLFGNRQPSSNSYSRSSFLSRASRSTTSSGESGKQTRRNLRRPSSLATKIARRNLSIKSRFSTVSYGQSTEGRVSSPSAINRRYAPGQKVLVATSARFSSLVNKHGYPPGEGDTPEERKGPYLYVYAEVLKLHFEDIAVFYTVKRGDTDSEERADANDMEPIPTERGEQAAQRASQTTAFDTDSPDTSTALRRQSRRGSMPYSDNKLTQCMQNICFTLAVPFLWAGAFWSYARTNFIAPCRRFTSMMIHTQARAFLYGQEPYGCRFRLTLVNIVVLCSVWYMFIDQARIAWFPPNADAPLAVSNFVVWLILVLELLFEVFIRPEGYKFLVVSDKAYSPRTARYINRFHLIIETVSLLSFAAEFWCLFDSSYSCSDAIPFSFHSSALKAALGPTRLDAFYGRAYFALIRLRVFGLVRHWKKMWIATTFATRIRYVSRNKAVTPTAVLNDVKNAMVPYGAGKVPTVSNDETKLSKAARQKKDNYAQLTNASTMGTALMITNSYRSLVILWVIVGLFPILTSLLTQATNTDALDMTLLLEESNLIANNEAIPTCAFFLGSVYTWIASVVSPDANRNGASAYLVAFDIQPLRCQYLLPPDFTSFTQAACQFAAGFVEGVLEGDPEELDYYLYLQGRVETICGAWLTIGDNLDPNFIASALGIRRGTILFYDRRQIADFTDTTGATTTETFSVTTAFDESFTLEITALASLLLQVTMFVVCLGGLSILRRDAELLVFGPLRRMLRIVAGYARNPLSKPRLGRRYATSRRVRVSTSQDLDTSSSSSDDEGGRTRADRQDTLGSFETEQLITAVTKITDLLRKCWGVAGADIISTNLETREGTLTDVFNPTVPGKSVYALFAFAAINDFDFALRALGGEIMILINDVAAVLHGEVYRWGFGDSGQCNKNLGAAFLLVFRIGLVREVIQKLEEAMNVVFSSKSSKHSSASRRRHQRGDSSNSVTSSDSGSSSMRHKRKSSQGVQQNPMSLSLQSLPGISTFTDRAVIGMLKSYAGIYRDTKIRKWNHDFRLSAGVGTFTVSMIFGMDAGWAVEGAVGSEYKIDATYLSPHVNMASRMMSACKQYGVTILLSQAVQELMSDTAKSKLRHLDTVTVKGSSVKQKIYTYDARHQGVDFFLYSRSDEQADFNAERYTPQIWNNDQDLRAMRQHVKDDFLDLFNEGRNHFIHGDWPQAMAILERANLIMVETAIDEGYLEDEIERLQMEADDMGAAEEIKRRCGDVPSLYLVNFMKSMGGVAPENWAGWHPLMRK